MDKVIICAVAIPLEGVIAGLIAGTVMPVYGSAWGILIVSLMAVVMICTCYIAIRLYDQAKERK